MPRRDALDVAALDLPRAQRVAAPQVEARIAQYLAAVRAAELGGRGADDEECVEVLHGGSVGVRQPERRTMAADRVGVAGEVVEDRRVFELVARGHADAAPAFDGE